MQDILTKIVRAIGSALLALFMMLLGPKVLGWIIVLGLRKMTNIIPKRYKGRYEELTKRISDVWGIEGEVNGKE